MVGTHENGPHIGKSIHLLDQKQVLLITTSTSIPHTSQVFLWALEFIQLGGQNMWSLTSGQTVWKRMSKCEVSYWNGVEWWFLLMYRWEGNSKSGQVNAKLQTTVIHIGERSSSMETKDKGKLVWGIWWWLNKEHFLDGEGGKGSPHTKVQGFIRSWLVREVGGLSACEEWGWIAGWV